MSSATAPARASSPSTTRLGGWLGRFDSPVTTYYLLVCVTVALVVFGLIMVLSASSIVSIGNTSSAYSIFLKQAAFAVVGLVALVIVLGMLLTAAATVISIMLA